MFSSCYLIVLPFINGQALWVASHLTPYCGATSSLSLSSYLVNISHVQLHQSIHHRSSVSTVACSSNISCKSYWGVGEPFFFFFWLIILLLKSRNCWLMSTNTTSVKKRYQPYPPENLDSERHKPRYKILNWD